MIKLVTPIGTAYYPQVSEPSYKFDENGMYSCKLHVSRRTTKSFLQELENLRRKHTKLNLQSKESKNSNEWKAYLVE